jgi:predicted RNA binding protein YcfA (HicA-like mRNA interferase family)
MLPKLPKLNAEEAERILLRAGFQLLRSKGSHRIYQKGKERFVLPFHKGKILHPKIIKELIEFTCDINV